MKRYFFFILLAACAVLSPAQAPVIRARLVPPKGIIVGQPVHLVVEVLVPNFFTGSPDFPVFELENAIVVLPEETPEHLNDQIEGKSYAGIRRTYFLYPQQPGDYRLPPAQLTVPYARTPPATTLAHPTLPSLTFHADIPEAAQGLSYFLPTTRLTIQQRWSSPLDKLRAGDMVERTVTVTTTKMQGMLVPPLPLEAPVGIRIYPEEPKVQDQKTDRGEFVFGRRIQSAKYFIQKEGDYTLPAIDLQWWNLTSNRLVKATLPEVHFVAVPNPGNVVELPPEPELAAVTQPKPTTSRSRYRRIAITAFITLAALFLLWLLYNYANNLADYLRTERERRNNSEAALFRNLVRACRRNDARHTYHCLLRWLTHAKPRKTLNEFLEQSNDEELSKQLNALARTLFAKMPEETWNGRSLAERLRRHRSRYVLKSRPRSRLPLLNP
jgi:hypothetical protein